MTPEEEVRHGLLPIAWHCLAFRKRLPVAAGNVGALEARK